MSVTHLATASVQNELPRRSRLDSCLATVVITTRNRKEELRWAIRSCLKQTAPVEVLVMDDGSTDGTTEMVRAEFPSARIVRSEQSFGLVVQRNRAAELVTTPIIISIDDDAMFSSSNTVEQILADFDHPRIGAVAIPYVDARKGPAIKQAAPDRQRIYVGDTYIGTAHAVRRSLFLRVGGYREWLFHQGEEGDFCIRMLNAGYVTRLGRAMPVFHYESPRRDLARMDFYGKRNLVLFAWHNVPMPYLPFYLVATVVNGLWHGIRCGRPRKAFVGLASGMTACIRDWRARKPVSRQMYRLFRIIRKRACVPLDELESRLPPLLPGGALRSDAARIR